MFENNLNSNKVKKYVVKWNDESKQWMENVMMFNWFFEKDGGHKTSWKWREKKAWNDENMIENVEVKMVM